MPKYVLQKMKQNKEKLTATAVSFLHGWTPPSRGYIP